MLLLIFTSDDISMLPSISCNNEYIIHFTYKFRIIIAIHLYIIGMHVFILVTCGCNKEFFLLPSDSRVDITEESSKHRRHNLISKVTLRLTPADDGSHYSCRAQHPALNTPIRASVKISVQCE